MKKQHNSNRGEKIANVVQMFVAQILGARDINVTLTGAESRGGLQFVRLYWQGRRDLQPRLDKIKDQVRWELAQRMNQKYVPDLQFVYDDTLEKAARIEGLLKGVAAD